MNRDLKPITPVVEQLLLERVKIGLTGVIPRYVIESMLIEAYIEQFVDGIVYKVSTHFLARKEKKGRFHRFKDWLGDLFDITPKTYYRVCPHKEFPIPLKNEYLHLAWLASQGEKE